MDTTDLNIRRATCDDAPALAALQKRVFAATYGDAIPPATLAAYTAHVFAPEQVAAELGQPDSIHLIAVVQQTVVGVSKLTSGEPPDHPVGATLELARLYVDAAWHGRGIAGALLRQILAHARAEAHAAVWLCVWERNARALAFYRKHGFVAFGAMPVFVDAIRFDDVLMRRNLDDC